MLPLNDLPCCDAGYAAQVQPRNHIDAIISQEPCPSTHSTSLIATVCTTWHLSAHLANISFYSGVHLYQEMASAANQRFQANPGQRAARWQQPAGKSIKRRGRCQIDIRGRLFFAEHGQEPWGSGRQVRSPLGMKGIKGLLVLPAASFPTGQAITSSITMKLQHR